MKLDEIKALDDKQLAVYLRESAGHVNDIMTIAEERGMKFTPALREVGAPGNYRRRLHIGPLSREF